MDSDELTHLADILRPASKEALSGTGILCLSTTYLHKLNCLLEYFAFSDDMTDMTSSFHVVQTSNNKTNILRDAQFLANLVQKTVNLKIVPDVVNQECSIELTRFASLKTLEVHKVNISCLFGLQKLRSQLHQIMFTHCLGSVEEILDKSAGDNTNRFIWNNLRQANFAKNGIRYLDNSFEGTPWLQILDLSHNELTDGEALCLLHNLKHLNLSYNKFEAVPRFRGPLCSSLQSINLKHNFIEDISGLAEFTNVIHIDLSQNCLLDHKALLAVSHLACLQWLNLQGNPISFHPHHRNLSCHYLNSNTATTKFCLDNVSLSKSEKLLVGTLYPIRQSSLSSSRNSLEESTVNSISERSKRVRNVTIEDDSIVREETPVAATPTRSSQHLKIKKQVEQLRQEFGEDWLHSNSGSLVQDVLGIEKKAVRMSSTPYESALDSMEIRDNISEIRSDVNFETANDQSFENTKIEEVEVESEESEGEDVYSGGEECMYLAQIEGEDVFVVVTESHISERDCATSKETARWHFNIVLSCDFVDESATSVKIMFDTVRRDRKQRIYEFEEDEATKFVNFIKEKLAKQEPSEQTNLITYQCMKCSETMTRERNTIIEQPKLICPKCKSNIVIEKT